ncbi:MAG TPA: ATP-dependent helicase [Patescibacteria group bacterium]|nr:ATP-dependent helicase [Patescibacteria group bacterium]
MDSFESVRLAASKLHSELVVNGADAINPRALVNAAINHFGFELTLLSPEDPALKGARALFDGQSGTICCENKGTEIDIALLVAHEIGHFVIHHNSTFCGAADIDPSRATEAAPVGLQKVEDYGAHERRELEANVFARDFLFPRDLAKKMHVQEDLSSAEIAEKTGLPIPIIRQQILDVLLLPEIVETEATPIVKIEFRPDPVQERAAHHRGSPFQLQAGPGTGKTRTLVKRIQSLLDEKVNPQSILVLTFSNRTAGELSERLTSALEETGKGIWIGTFHAFGLDIIRRFHDRLGLPSDPVLFDRSDAIAVLEEILPTLPLYHYRNLWDPVIVLREILQGISRAKDELVGPIEYRALAKQMHLKAGSDEAALKAAEKCLEVAEIYDRYEEAKQARNAVDFGDLIMLPALLLEKDAAVRLAVQLRHRHVLVDEYQDVNRASVRLVRAVAGEGRNLWVVGDARQSIYRFRGASSANMAAFADDFASPTFDQLGISYRSTQKIIDTFSQFSVDMGSARGMQPLSLAANRGTGTSDPETRTYNTLDDEAAGIAASILELQSSGVSLRDQAVLCRTNGRLNDIAIALEARGIAVLHLGSLFEREEVRDLLAILTLAVDPFGSGLVRIGAMPRYDIPLQDILRMSQQLEKGDGPALQQLGNLLQTPKLSAKATLSIQILVKDLEGFTTDKSPWDILTTYLLDKTDLARRLSAGRSVGSKMQAIAIWQFLNFLRDNGAISSGAPIQRTLDRVRNLVLLSEERDLRQVPAPALHINAVRLMTVHASKGLEFEAVHIPGLTVSGMPSSYRGSRCPPPEGLISGAQGSVGEEAKMAHGHEEECLFFVAASRARTYLRLYLCQKQRDGKSRNPSPYLETIKGKTREIASPELAPPLPGIVKKTDIDLALPPDWPINDNRISSYEKCPRRFFYTHILGIGTARRTTPFSKTHDCIYELIEWLSKEQIISPPSLEQAQTAFEEIWRRRGPVDHAFVDGYHQLAGQLVAGLIKAGAGRRFREAQPLAIDFSNGTVLVEPDEIAEREDGIIVIRRLRTGRMNETEHDKLEYTLYLRAAREHFGPSAVVESLHLTNDERTEVALTPAKLKNRAETTEKILKGIWGGNFQPDPDPFSCPRCPHFFICAATPSGPISLK